MPYRSASSAGVARLATPKPSPNATTRDDRAGRGAADERQAERGGGLDGEDGGDDGGQSDRGVAAPVSDEPAGDRQHAEQPGDGGGEGGGVAAA